METDFPWIYVAMIAIAFISWIFNRIQESTARRKRGEEAEDDLDWEEEAPEGGRSKEVMREIMEALGQSPPVEAPPPPVQVQVEKRQAEPPPIRRTEVSAPQLSAAEKAALERVRQRQKKKPAARKRKSGVLTIKEMLRDPTGIRQAVVLREVLDKPRSMRPWNS